MQRHLSATIEVKAAKHQLVKEEFANKDIAIEEHRIKAEELCQKIRIFEAKVEKREHPNKAAGKGE